MSLRLLVTVIVLFFSLGSHGFNGIHIHRDPTYVRVHIPLPLDMTWDMSKRVLAPYTIEAENKDSHEILTAWESEPYNIKLFRVPGYFPTYDEVRSHLTLRFLPSTEKAKEGTHIFVIKTFETFPSIFRGWIPRTSDGVEEYVIAYRIRQLAYYQSIVPSE